MNTTETIYLSKRGMKELKKTIANLERDRHATLNDLRDIDKPRNGIIRLPNYTVQEKKPPVFRERDIYTREGLADLASAAGFGSVECKAVESPSVFIDFDDYWKPFTLGAGPAPGYCMSLEPPARERLKQKLQETLPRGPDGSIPLKLRAWAIRAIAP